MATEYKSEDPDLESWIEEGVSFLQADITIYRDPAMFREYGPLMEKIQILEAELKPPKEPKRDRGLEEESVGGEQAATFTDESLGDETKSVVREELEKAKEQAQKLWEKYEANKEVWTLRRLNEDEVKEIRDAFGEMPAMPERPSSTKMSKAQRLKAVEAMEKWSEEVAEYRQELHIRCLPRAVLKVVVKGKTVVDALNGKSISEDDIRRLLKRPGGDAHFKELENAMTALTTEGVEIMAPHSEGTGA